MRPGAGLHAVDRRQQASLHVRRAAGIHQSVPDLGFERRRFPKVHGVFRLHVVVAVNQHGRQRRVGHPQSDDGGMSSTLDRADVRHARLLQTGDDPLRRPADVT